MKTPKIRGSTKLPDNGGSKWRDRLLHFLSKSAEILHGRNNDTLLIYDSDELCKGGYKELFTSSIINVLCAASCTVALLPLATAGDNYQLLEQNY